MHSRVHVRARKHTQTCVRVRFTTCTCISGHLGVDAQRQLFVTLPVQDDFELLEVAEDLGIKVPIKKRERVSLGQSYPIMDDPDSLPPSAGETPAASPRASPTVTPRAVEPSPPAVPASSCPAPISPSAANALAESGQASEMAEVDSNGRRQLKLEDLSACTFRPYTNQAFHGERPVARPLRQTTLGEMPALDGPGGHVPEDVGAAPMDGQLHGHTGPAQAKTPKACAHV